MFYVKIGVYTYRFLAQRKSVFLMQKIDGFFGRNSPWFFLIMSNSLEQIRFFDIHYTNERLSTQISLFANHADVFLKYFLSKLLTGKLQWLTLISMEIFLIIT